MAKKAREIEFTIKKDGEVEVDYENREITIYTEIIEKKNSPEN